MQGVVHLLMTRYARRMIYVMYWWLFRTVERQGAVDKAGTKVFHGFAGNGRALAVVPGSGDGDDVVMEATIKGAVPWFGARSHDGDRVQDRAINKSFCVIDRIFGSEIGR